MPVIYLSLFNGNKIKQNPCFLLVCFNFQIETFFFGPGHEIMAFITSHIYKFVHKQNIGYFLFIVVLLSQRIITSFHQVSVLSTYFFKLTGIIELSIVHLYKLQSILFYYKKMMLGRTQTANSKKLHVSS